MARHYLKPAIDINKYLPKLELMGYEYINSNVFGIVAKSRHDFTAVLDIDTEYIINAPAIICTPSFIAEEKSPNYWILHDKYGKHEPDTPDGKHIYDGVFPVTCRSSCGSTRFIMYIENSGEITVKSSENVIYKICDINSCDFGHYENIVGLDLNLTPFGYEYDLKYNTPSGGFHSICGILHKLNNM